MTMPTPQSVQARACPDCGEALPANGSSCASCDFDPAAHNRRRLWLGAAGMVLTLSVVFAPIGLPLLWAANRHLRLARGGGRQTRSILGHLLAVGKRQSALDGPRFHREEFTRGGTTATSWLGRPPEI